MDAAARLSKFLDSGHPSPLFRSCPTIPDKYLYVALLLCTQREYDVAPWRVALQTWFTGSDVFHVQVAFDNPQGPGYVTYSTDAYRGVFVDTRKSFSRDSWRFYAIRATPQQYTEALDYCEQLVRDNAGYNGMGADCQPFWPWSGSGRSFFCSELVAAVLQRVDLVDKDARPERFSPGDIQTLMRKFPGRVIATTPTVVGTSGRPPALSIV